MTVEEVHRYKTQSTDTQPYNLSKECEVVRMKELFLVDRNMMFTSDVHASILFLLQYLQVSSNPELVLLFLEQVGVPQEVQLEAHTQHVVICYIMNDMLLLRCC